MVLTGRCCDTALVAAFLVGLFPPLLARLSERRTSFCAALPSSPAGDAHVPHAAADGPDAALVRRVFVRHRA